MTLPVAIEPQPLSRTLKAAVMPRVEWDYSDAGGGMPREVPWELPVVTEALKAEAVRALRQLEAGMAPAPKQTVREWLAALGTLCAGQMPAADAKAKIAGYSALLEHPAICFTRATLAEAGRRFKWFPSFGEVAEFLDGQAQPQRDLRARLRRIAQAPVSKTEEPKGRRWSELTPEEREAFRRRQEAMRAEIAQASAALTRPARVGAEQRRPAREIDPAKALLGG